MNVGNSQTIENRDMVINKNKKTSLEETVTTTKLILPEKVEKNEKNIYDFFKRTIDIIGSIFGIIILIPTTVIIYIANKICKDDGPIFFVQERIGKNGKIFKMYKFRSMVVNAEEKLETYLLENEDAREEYRIYKKLKKDPRITKIGNFIRKTSIDEIPQFINVFKGEMSLVGPRPYTIGEKEDMGEFYTYIIKKKPGITGYWQVNGRSETAFKDRLNMDFNYYKHSNIGTDAKILAKTVVSVMKKEGAA